MFHGIAIRSRYDLRKDQTMSGINNLILNGRSDTQLKINSEKIVLKATLVCKAQGVWGWRGGGGGRGGVRDEKVA